MTWFYICPNCGRQFQPHQAKYYWRGHELFLVCPYCEKAAREYPNSEFEILEYDPIFDPII